MQDLIVSANQGPGTNRHIAISSGGEDGTSTVASVDSDENTNSQPINMAGASTLMPHPVPRASLCLVMRPRGARFPAREAVAFS